MISGCLYGLVQHQSFGNGQPQKTALQMTKLTAKGGFACALTAGALICLFWLPKSSK